MKSIEKFNNLIQELKELQITNTPKKHSNLEKFSLLTLELAALITNSKKPIDKSILANNLQLITNSLKHLKSKVYNNRLIETKEFIDQNSEMFKVSSFELMEHNFRENTHSNILKYLFDYTFTNNEGIEALFLLISEIKAIKIKELKNKLLLRKYTIEREFNIGNGRIDLLIKDEYNKFIIVIENKVLANIGEKDFNEEKNITMTQLDLYKNHFSINDKYKNWDNIFILLSYKDVNNFNNTDFELINYKILYRILKQTNFRDNIAKDYLTLLYSLMKNIHNKNWLIEQSNLIKNQNGNLNLNTLETINNFTYGG